MTGSAARIVAATGNTDFFEIAARAQTEPVRPLDSGLVYRNENFVFVGEAIARICGMSFEVCLQRYVLSAADLEHTAFARSSQSEELNLALAYVPEGYDLIASEDISSRRSVSSSCHYTF